MITLSPSTYIKIAGALAIAGAIGWVYYIHSDRQDKIEALRVSEEVLAATKESLTAHIRNQELENWARTQYINELEEAKREKQRIEKCIADKSCVATIRVRVPATCPAGTATGDSTGATEYSAQLSPDSLRTRSDLESSISNWESLHGLCMRTLRNWESKQSK